MGILDKKIKAKWLKALRSGKYKQTRKGTLYNKKSNAYCCLGVLQHSIDNKVEDGFDVPTSEWYDKKLGVDLDTVSVKSVGGRAKANFQYASVQDVLTDFNDKAKYNFAKIADWIEKHL